MLTLIASLVLAATPVDPRYCGQPARDTDGRISRSTQVLAEFQRLHPCPSTGKTFGICPGWSKDHIIPLVCGGCDAVGNLQWPPPRDQVGERDPAKGPVGAPGLLPLRQVLVAGPDTTRSHPDELR